MDFLGDAAEKIAEALREDPGLLFRSPKLASLREVLSQYGDLKSPESKDASFSETEKGEEDEEEDEEDEEVLFNILGAMKIIGQKAKAYEMLEDKDSLIYRN